MFGNVRARRLAAGIYDAVEILCAGSKPLNLYFDGNGGIDDLGRNSFAIREVWAGRPFENDLSER